MSTSPVVAPPTPPTAPVGNALESLLGIVMGVLSGDGCAAMRATIQLRGYVLVGSASLIGATSDGDSDLDVVLLSDATMSGGGYESGAALFQILVALRAASDLRAHNVHFVSANVPIVKVTRGDTSIDLLWLAGVVFPPPSGVTAVGGAEEEPGDEHTQMVIEPGGGSFAPPTTKTKPVFVRPFPAPTLAEEAGDEPPPPAYTPPPTVHRYDATDERLHLPSVNGGGAADAIRLSRLLGRTMQTSPSFTKTTILRLRAWAKARHLYGSKYGYPGGSAWTVAGTVCGGVPRSHVRTVPTADALGLLHVFRLGERRNGGGSGHRRGDSDT